MTDDNGNDDNTEDGSGKGPGAPPQRGKGGYRKPPREYRYPPGHSGNPKGRPKGSKNKPVPIHDARCDEIVFDEAFRIVKVRDNGVLIEVPLYRAMMRNMATRAASGDVRAAKLVQYAVNDASRRQKAENDEYRNLAAEYIRDAKEEIRRREAKGLPIDDIQPHPDDFRWDHETALPYLADPASEPSLGEHRKQLKLIDQMIRNEEKILAKAKSEAEKVSHRSALSKLRTYREALDRKIKRQERQQGEA